jgi:hypothetical protein
MRNFHEIKNLRKKWAYISDRPNKSRQSRINGYAGILISRRTAEGGLQKLVIQSARRIGCVKQLVGFVASGITEVIGVKPEEIGVFMRFSE